MRRWLVLLLFVSGCIHFEKGCPPLLFEKESVIPGYTELAFDLKIPKGVEAVWLRYGSDINSMGATSDISNKSGKVKIVNLRPGKTYYWQIVQKNKCGIFMSRIYENTTLPYKNITNRNPVN